MNEPSSDLSELVDRLISGESIDWTTESGRFPAVEDRARLTALFELSLVARMHASGGGGLPCEPAAPLPAWGPFELNRLIREDASGALYEAWDPGVARPVLLRLSPLLDSSEGAQHPLLARASRMAGIRHHHLAGILGAKVRDGVLGLWCEFIEGQTLAESLEDAGPFSPAEAALVARDLCGVLSILQREGTCCGALTPATVTRERGGRIVLTESMLADPEPAAGLAGDLRNLADLVEWLVVGVSDLDGRQTLEISPLGLPASLTRILVGMRASAPGFGTPGEVEAELTGFIAGGSDSNPAG